MSWGQFDLQAPAWASGLGPLGWCSTQKPAPCAVVGIDEGDDGGGSDSEVFIVGAGTAGKVFPTTSRCQAKKGEGSSGNVIDLDDVGEGNEVSRGDKAGSSTARGGGSPAATTPRPASPRNRYGLDRTSDSSEGDLSKKWDSEYLSEKWDSESDSESDVGGTSDCEIMDDTCGTARKMWESASSSRKRMHIGVRKGKEGIATASTSSSGSETQLGENADGLFGLECLLDEDVFQFFKAAEQGRFPDDEECFDGNFSDGKETNSNGDGKENHAEGHINREGFTEKEGEKNTTGGANVDCDPSSGQNVYECSNRNVSNGKRPGSSATSTLVDDPDDLAQFTLVQEASDFQASLIGEREKLKETAEFKRAAEEEWASRHGQIQIQAEEAKKLRKRKKADALRLLEIERKQKKRLQEVRKSQKMNEEEIQLKEQYRCTLQKELERTEMIYRDTSSILRVLGIPVEGGEVRAALKQAQVKFHPDRVSRSDIYQQVKAEETFKLISLLKEKLPSVR